MALTGHPGAAPMAVGVAVADRIDHLLDLVGALAPLPPGFDPAAALTGRAGCFGFTRRGRTSANGSCRLLPADGGWVAPNLCRPEDYDAVPALTGTEPGADPWVALAAAAAADADALVDCARLLGVAIGDLRPRRRPRGVDPAGPDGGSVALERSAGAAEVVTGEALPRIADGAATGGRRRPLVVDLSSLWAGPLCARILTDCGYEVVFLDSVGRPDPTRALPAWWGWLRRGQRSFRADLRSGPDRDRLAELLQQADVVIEASRPRALQGLGLDPSRLRLRPGAVWVSITGYGRDGAEPQRIAFGDDAAVSAGLVGWDPDGPVFCGDALADPITGLTAAAAVLTARAADGGVLLDVAMAAAAAAAAVGPVGCQASVEPAGGTGWTVTCGHGTVPVQAPAVPMAPRQPHTAATHR
jgi:hypothetical protein